MFKASPSKSMSEHLTKMGKGKAKGHMFSKKKSSGGKGKFSLFKKKTVEDSDHDDM